MNDLLAIPLISKNGVRGKVLTASRLLDEEENKKVTFDGGLEATVQSTHLHLRPDGTYYLDQVVEMPLPAAERPSDVVMPVIQEQAYFSKRKVETGRVQIRKSVSVEQVTIEEPITREDVEVLHVPINKIVDAMLAVRVEGDTTILSVYEEETYTATRLILREEVHITKKRSTEPHSRTISLRKESVQVERLPLAKTSGAA